PAGCRHVECVRKVALHEESLGHTEHWMRNLARGSVLLQLFFRAIDGHREADADASGLAAGGLRSVNRRVDADHVPARIEQRTATVARIDGRVSLDQAFEF